MVLGFGLAVLYPVLHILVLLICIGCVFTFCDANFVKTILSKPLVGIFVAFSANLSLQIYLFHEPLTHQSELFKIVWPFNIALLCLVTIAGSTVLFLASEYIRQFITGKKL